MVAGGCIPQVIGKIFAAGIGEVLFCYCILFLVGTCERHRLVHHVSTLTKIK